MTITSWENGWETGDDSWTTDNLTSGSTYKRCGSNGGRAITVSAGSDYSTRLDVTGCSNSQSIYARCSFNFPLSLPASGEYTGLYRIRDGNGDDLIEVGVKNNSGTYDLELYVEHESGGTTYSTTVSLSTATWYCLQVKLYYSNTGHVYVKLDGTTEISEAGIDTRDDSFNANYMDFGVINATAGTQIYFDDCAVDPSSYPSCKTPPGSVSNVSATSTLSDKVTITWTKASDATGYYVYRDGDLIHTLGDVATVNDSGADPPTITPGTASATDGTYTDKVRLSLSGESIANGTTHTYEVIPFNSCGTGGSDSDTGYRDAKTLNKQWQEYDGGWSDITGATTDPYDYTVASGAPHPTITGGNASASDGTQVTHVELEVVGESANNGASRNYRCKLTSTDATTKYSSENTGYVGVGFLTYQWQRSDTDAPSGWGNISGATTDSYNDSGAPAPTITPGTASATDGTYTDKVRLSLSGESANNGATRYYRCYLTATGASSTYSNNDSGYRGVGSLTYQWRRSAGDSDASFSNLSGATTDPYDDTGAPVNGDGRYYYCVLSASGATSQDSTHDRGYRDVLYTMIGSPTSWSWGNPTSGVSQVRISTDGGLTWDWGLYTGTITIPNGSPTGWVWLTVTA